MSTGRITPAETVIDQRLKKRNSSTLTFPHTLGHHAMIFNFKEYKYGNSAHATVVNTESIVLPLPKNLQDNMNVKVGADEIQVMGSMAANAGNSISKLGEFGGLGSKLKGMFNKTKDAAQGLSPEDLTVDNAIAGLSIAADTAVFLAGAGLGAIAPDITKGLGAGSGTAINPYATLVFSGVDLKVHTFEWTLSPDNAEEAETLRRIIGTIQNQITPEIKSVGGEGLGEMLGDLGETTLSRGLLKYPSMVDCFFYGIDANFFYKMKTCMISQFNVDYAPNGSALNRGGKPSTLRINMVMTEAAIHTKADYGPDLFIPPAVAEEVSDEVATNEKKEGSDESVDSLGVQGVQE
jgi:uncharacterized spore protein YtfJ